MNSNFARLYWQCIVLLLAAHFAGVAQAMPLALMAGAVQTLHAWAGQRHWRHLSVQVRASFLGLLLLGLLPGLWPLHLLQFMGTSAMLVTDYCLLARLLSLLPWNRHGPISIDVVRRVLLTPPSPGPISMRVSD